MQKFDETDGKTNTESRGVNKWVNVIKKNGQHRPKILTFSI